MNEKLSYRKMNVKRGESGQALVLFAVMMMAMMGFLALGIDLALVVGGQRRFDQNGADAAALAAGKLLAGSVGMVHVDDPTTPANDPQDLPYFNQADQYVYQVVRMFAGLRAEPSNWSSADPSGLNQNIGLSTRTKIAATLEYWGTREWGATWCYSPTGPMPRRDGGMPRCTLFPRTIDGTTTLLAPLPDPAVPFKVRVTASSTTNGYFSRVVGIGDGAPPPPARTDNNAAACTLPQAGAPGGPGVWNWTALAAPGRTTCAHAVVAIRGRSQLDTSGLGILPVTTGVCQLADPNGDPLMVLWGGGGQTEDCGLGLHSYGNIIDLTDPARWCDTGTPNYPFTQLMPAEAKVAGGPCEAEPPVADPSWEYSKYTPDSTVRNSIMPGYPEQNNDRSVDMVWWIARGFKGDLDAGVWLPTYCSATSGITGLPQNCSTQGQNVAAAFYCTPGNEQANACLPSGLNSSGTYFFAKNQPNFQELCPDPLGTQYGLGCRDVGVPIWDDASKAQGADGSLGWQYDGNMTPDRVHIRELRRLRLYCRYDSNGLCTRAPSFEGGGTSRVYGQFISGFVTGDCTTNCASGVTIYDNFAKLE